MNDIYRQLKPGTQILYVPNHAQGDLDHPDVEKGFVVYVKPETETAFCRYFHKDRPTVLRTTANSEGTPIRNLVVQEYRPQFKINRLMEKIVEGWPG
jgi:hypothetical protein